MYHLYFSDNPNILFDDQERAKRTCDKVVRFTNENKAFNCALKNDEDYLNGYQYYVCWHKDEMVFQS